MLYKTVCRIINSFRSERILYSDEDIACENINYMRKVKALIFSNSGQRIGEYDIHYQYWRIQSESFEIIPLQRKSI